MKILLSLLLLSTSLHAQILGGHGQFGGTATLARASASPAAITRIIDGTANSSDHDVVSKALNAAGGNWAVVGVCSIGSTTAPVVTANGGNTCTQRDTRTDVGTNVRATVAECSGGTFDASSSFTATLTASFPGINVKVYAGVSSFDQTNHTEFVAATSSATGSVDPGSQDNELFHTLLCKATDVTGDAIDSSFSTPLTNAGTGGAAYGTSSSDFIQTTHAAKNPTWSWTNLQSGTTLINTWKKIP